jgi:meiosis-specific protein HOP1
MSLSLAGCKPQSFHHARLFATPDITTHHGALSPPSCYSENKQPPFSARRATPQNLPTDIMTSMQLVKQRNVRKSTTTTKLDQAQSLQLVQTMLHSALSTLTYLRNLFPDRAFVQRRYEMRDTVIPYTEYAAARMPSVNDDAEMPYTNVPILIRDHSRRADVFLDWLVSGDRTSQWHSTNASQEKGAFPELESGDLRAVQILIHPDRKRRDEVLETYTFIVRYVVAEDGRRTPSAVVTEAPENQGATTSSAHAALQELLRNVDRLCDDLPQLPSGRYLSMALVYDKKEISDEVKDKRVQGFSPCKEDTLSMGEARGWRAYTRTLEFDSGHHE